MSARERQDLVDQVCDWGNAGDRFVYHRMSNGDWYTYCPICKLQLGLGGQCGSGGDIRYNHLMEHSDDELKHHIVTNLMRGT